MILHRQFNARNFSKVLTTCHTYKIRYTWSISMIGYEIKVKQKNGNYITQHTTTMEIRRTNTTLGCLQQWKFVFFLQSIHIHYNFESKK